MKKKINNLSRLLLIVIASLAYFWNKDEKYRKEWNIKYNEIYAK